MAARTNYQSQQQEEGRIVVRNSHGNAGRHLAPLQSFSGPLPLKEQKSCSQHSSCEEKIKKIEFVLIARSHLFKRSATTIAITALLQVARSK